MQSRVRRQLRISTSVAFGRRVMTPLVLRFMQQHPELQIDLGFDDRYVEPGGAGHRPGACAWAAWPTRHSARATSASTPGCWSPRRTTWHAPRHADEAGRPGRVTTALVYSSVQGDDRWHFTGADGQVVQVTVRGPLRSNNLSALLAAARAGLGPGGAALVRGARVGQRAAWFSRCSSWSLPAQEIHAVFPSPKFVPAKVRSFCDFLSTRFGPDWWAMT